MKANNYEVAEAGETITFRGLVARSKSQAFFLTFCTAIGMASLALVLQIQLQDLGKRVLCSAISFYVIFVTNNADTFLSQRNYAGLPLLTIKTKQNKNSSPPRYWLSQLVLPGPPLSLCGRLLLAIR